MNLEEEMLRKAMEASMYGNQPALAQPSVEEGFMNAFQQADSLLNMKVKMYSDSLAYKIASQNGFTPAKIVEAIESVGGDPDMVLSYLLNGFN